MPIELLVIVIVSIIGLLDTSYLIYHKIRGTEVACLFFPKEWCYKVQHAPQSKTFGIPNSMLGFGMYAFILILALLINRQMIALWPMRLVIGIGFLFSMYFTYVQAFILRAFCTWCVLSAINFVILTVTAFIFIPW